MELRNIWKSYGENHVLENFSHTFPLGETTCIMGPSGCGKTTLLRLLLGLESPDSGEILEGERLRKSAVFQEDRLCGNISASANLRLVNPGLTREAAEDLLSRLGLGGNPAQPVREFSGGMRRRVAILRALAAQYDLLLADEPFQGLDEALKLQTMEFFKESTRGKTLVLVTHDQREADFFEGRLLRL